MIYNLEAWLISIVTRGTGMHCCIIISSIGFAGGAGVSGSGSLLFFCSIVPERMRYNLNPFVRNNG